eukprot:1159699-Pelagomonas_calceolata.AAC.1
MREKKQIGSNWEGHKARYMAEGKLANITQGHHQTRMTYNDELAAEAAVATQKKESDSVTATSR